MYHGDTVPRAGSLQCGILRTRDDHSPDYAVSDPDAETSFDRLVYIYSIRYDLGITRTDACGLSVSWVGFLPRLCVNRGLREMYHDRNDTTIELQIAHTTIGQ